MICMLFRSLMPEYQKPLRPGCPGRFAEVAEVVQTPFIYTYDRLSGMTESSD